MLLRLLFDGTPMNIIVIYIITSVPAIVLSLSIHEWAHAWVAYLLGDPTAYYEGRMTINPMKHLDPIGMAALLIVGIGWAKPVPIDSRYLKYPRWYTVLISLAGPFSNLLLAFLSWPIMRLLTYITVQNEFLLKVIYVFIIFFYLVFFYNITLAVFNCLILPPLDGSRIILALLPTKAYVWVVRHEVQIRYITLGIFLVTSFIRINGSSILSIVIDFLSSPIIIAFVSFWSLIIPNTEVSIGNMINALNNLMRW